jgi:hypothetical protein
MLDLRTDDQLARPRRRYRDGQARRISKDVPSIVLYAGRKKHEYVAEIRFTRHYLYWLQRSLLDIALVVPNERAKQLGHLASLATVLHDVWEEASCGNWEGGKEVVVKV